MQVKAARHVLAARGHLTSEDDWKQDQPGVRLSRVFGVVLGIHIAAPGLALTPGDRIEAIVEGIGRCSFTYAKG